MAQADHTAGLPRPLRDIIDGDAALEAAWSRGQFLRNLRSAALKLTSLSKVARFLKIPGAGPELRRMLDADDEARNVFDSSWLKSEFDNRQRIIDSADAGNHQAIKSVALWLREKPEAGQGQAVSFSRIPMMQLAELFHVTRQAIDKWTRQRGLPRNADGTFDLADVLPWFENDITERIGGAVKPNEVDETRTLKAERLRRELDKDLGRLLERDKIVKGFTARFVMVKRSLETLPRDIGPLLENQSAMRIGDILTTWVTKVLSDQKTVPDEFSLPDDAGGKLLECLELLQ